MKVCWVKLYEILLSKKCANETQTYEYYFSFIIIGRSNFNMPLIQYCIELLIKKYVLIIEYIVLY